MRTLIVALLVLAVSVVLALVVKEDNGYILIGYGHWSVEGSLAFFALLNLALFAALYLAMRLLARVWSMPREIHDWQDRRGAKRARGELTQGLLELSEGHWKNAEQSLTRHAGNSETPLLNYLAAARSAQQQGAHDRRDHYLQLAHESMPSADVAVGLTQAELQLAHEQIEQALATLKHLRRIAPKHTHVLKMLKELYERVGDWEGLNRLLPELKKRKVIDKQQMQELEVRILCNLLDRASDGGDLQQLNAAWKGFSRSAQENKQLLTRYAHHLMEKGAEAQVEALLRSAITRQWDEQLVELYSLATVAENAKQLSVAEGWLSEHPRNPVLLLTLGRLCMKNQLWGKARSYLEASIGANPTAAAYRELGALLEGMGERELSSACYRSGLELSSDYAIPEFPENLASQGHIEKKRELEQPTDINPPKLGLKV